MSALEYIKVKWLHELPDEPVLLVSELDCDRMELRKVEVYRDGRSDAAHADMATGSTKLSIEPIPSSDEIQSDDQFVVELISATEFEALWEQCLRSHA